MDISYIYTVLTILQIFMEYNYFCCCCRILQRTSISTNIKERLDFSCALFGPDGGLVSNAPHIPVHLGSMQEAVQYQVMDHTEQDGNLHFFHLQLPAWV